MILEELRKEIVFYGKQLLESGMTMHTGGNLSAKDPETGLIAMKPSARAYEQMRPEDIAVIDTEGNLIDGKYPPSSEWRMHLAIYRRFPNARAVVHCHSPYATAMAAIGQQLPLISHGLCCYCTEPVKTARFAMPGSEELGITALQAMGKANDVAFLQNHGQVAYGASLWYAMDAACAAEQAAQTWFLTWGIGEATVIEEKDRKTLRDHDPMLRQEMGETVKVQAV